MPAMPNDKAAAVSLSDSNFGELKLKDLTTTTATIVDGDMASTSTVPTVVTGRQQQDQTHMQIHQRVHPNTTCGCGTATATRTERTVTKDVTENVDSIQSNPYYINGHTSPIAAAAAVSSSSQQHQRNGLSGYHSSSSSNSSRLQYENMGNNNYNVTASCSNSGSVSVSGINNQSAASAAIVTPPKKSPKDYIFGKYIGEGSFSNVYLAVDIHNRREYAIKVCEKQHILREKKQDYIRREREVMHMLTNVPGFVNLSCTFQDARSLYFVMTYAKNGDLLPYINKVGSFDVNCTRHYAAELVLACEQMHAHNVVHRDLKPENILLDEDMHMLIADFGSSKILTAEERAAAVAAAAAVASLPGETAKTSTHGQRTTSSSCVLSTSSSSTSSSTSDGSVKARRPSRTQLCNYALVEDQDDDEDDDDTNDTGSDDVDSPSRQPRQRQRKGSFVGTAQYVSPEVLQNGPITPAADLWALGCIIYQMISGLPPFRGSNDYAIFREILGCSVHFPLGFDKDAEDLVRQLLKIAPEDRLGAQDLGSQYISIRTHPFFADVNFDNLLDVTPPPIYPYLPGVPKDDNFRDQILHLEPGLDNKQLTRLLGMELGTVLGDENREEQNEIRTITKNVFDLPEAEKQKRLAQQQLVDKWHTFADHEVILKKGYVNKRKGLFARKRMLLLTTGPRLIYIDPVQMIKKGEIPWSPDLRVEPKNFKIFFVHTPNRTYYLDDPTGYSLQWVEAIEKMRKLTYNIADDEAVPSTSSAADDLATTTPISIPVPIPSTTNTCSPTTTNLKTTTN